MEKRIFHSIIATSLISVFLLAFFLTSFIHEHLFQKAQSELKITANRLRLALNDKPSLDLDLLLLNNRISIIEADGTLSFDSAQTKPILPNYSGYPEIKALISEPYGESIRYSETLGEQTYYYALKLNDGRFLRLSLQIKSDYKILMEMWPWLLLSFLVIVIIAVFISRHLARRIITPLYKPDSSSGAEPYSELRAFYRKIKSQKNFIELLQKKLAKKEQEFAAITENVADGLMVLNTDGDILSINRKASLIFGRAKIDYKSKNIIELNRSLELSKSVKKALAGDNEELRLSISARHYQLHISPIKDESAVIGAVVLVVDATKRVELEKIRQEFSANVSHELKTPLTSISGYAELIKSGLAQGGDIPQFAEKIYNEVQNLISLIEDIIKLSHLDEQGENSINSDLLASKVSVDLKNLIENVTLRLGSLAQRQEITFELNLKPLTTQGAPSLLEETFFNVIENAIKYNHPGGKVTIELFQKDKWATTQIHNSGPTIPPESLPRVFERFYRADTSHSKEVPGTGLGLAIVKHAVNLHGGTVSIDSRPNDGTLVEIKLENLDLIPT